ncbi:uncharacterized protein LOC111696033 [Eurytemora carolleeae]|uniref:uncharacterized protein LOC111696033 n=1 Tax=Eurytemora carolleeae TaxID=1294199 RepID=UPI000C791A83|nr:uncharacterized protein LOC111696033 [Eurytemora carolleeae]|eukprot:XP_023321321.1 uncharacterized protein LOC111696033 [Eurytemora affinis]
MVQLKARFSILSEFKDTFSNLKSTSDVQISCGRGVFSTHRIILASLSSFLENIFKDLDQEQDDAILIIPDVDNKCLEDFLRILYGVEEGNRVDHQLIELFHLIGIDIAQFISEIQPSYISQVYGLKSVGFGRLDTESFARIEPGSFARIDPLLSLEIEEELLRYDDLETILPSHTINPTQTILTSREGCRE